MLTANSISLSLAFVCCAWSARAPLSYLAVRQSHPERALQTVGESPQVKDPARDDPRIRDAQALFDEAKKALAAADPEGARARATAGIDTLLSSPSFDGERWAALLAELSIFARETGELQAAERALRKVLEYGLRTRSHDDFPVQWSRENLAITLYTLGDLQGAQSLFEQALEVFSRTLAEDNPELQYAREGLAATKRGLGDLHGARALYEQVLEVRERTLPDEHPDVQLARQNLATITRLLGDLQGARTLFNRVLDVALRTLPDDHPTLQMARGNLADTMRSLGDLHGARALEEQVLEARTRTLPYDHPDVQFARQSLAITLRLLGDLQGARALEEHVLAVRSRTLPDDHPDLQAARTNYALTLQELGDLQTARLFYEKVLDVLSRTFPEDHPDLQGARWNLAVALGSLGDLQGARSLLEHVLEAYSRTLTDDHPLLQAARLNLAHTIKALGEGESARALEEKVLEVYSRTLPDDHPDLQEARTSFAITLLRLREFESARALFAKVLEVGLRTLPHDHPRLLLAQGNLALALHGLGDLEGARALLETTLHGLSRTLSDDHPDLQQARSSLAETIASLHSHDAGREHTVVDDTDRAEFTDLAQSFARALGHAGQKATLAAGSREADERCSNLLSDVSRSLSFASGLGVFAFDADLDRAAFIASEETRGASVLSAAWARAASTDFRYEPARRALQQASEELAQLARRGAKPDELSAARARRETAEHGLIVLGKEHLHDADIVLGGDVARVAATLDRQDALVAYRRYTRTTIEDPALTPERSVESLCAFVLRSPAELVRVELGPIARIEDRVSRWRRSIGVEHDASAVAAPSGSGAEPERGVGARTSPADDDARAADELRMLLFDPLRPALENARRLIVCPDDVVCLVSLDALPSGSSGPEHVPTERTLLGDSMRIETRTTLSELLFAERELAGNGALVAFGDVAFDREPSLDATSVASVVERWEHDAARAEAHGATRAPQDAGVLRGSAWEHGFTELHATREEVEGIARCFEARFGAAAEEHVLVRSQASRESLFTLAPRARFLHLATHGWFAPDSIKSTRDVVPLDAQLGWGLRMDTEKQVRGMSPMLLCGLALAGASLPAGATASIPGLVTADELSTLDLSQCELAVLSACDTNVGERRAGQGVASLQTALQMAGARSVITSLWKVPDAATKELMLEFYRRLWVEKEEKSVALWHAKQKLREARDEGGALRYATRDWAAWVLTGDPR